MLVAPVCSSFVFMQLPKRNSNAFLFRLFFFQSPPKNDKFLQRLLLLQYFPASMDCPNWGLLRSRGSTGRTALDASGNESYPSVSEGNLIASRTLVLLYIAAALQVWWILEQPVNSLMQDLPAFQFFMKQVKTWRYAMKMFDFGGPTDKPTWLYSGRLINFS